MPSTRLRSQSRSQLGVSPVVRESQLESQTLDTLSTAVLPISYAVHLATTRTISPDEQAKEYIRGQEYLNDGVRRLDDKDGDLTDLARARKPKRRRVQVENTSEAGNGDVKLDKDVYWYTAHLKYPCSCDLAPLRRAYTLRHSPPLAGDLDDLPDLPDHGEGVRPGDEIPEWDNGQAGYVDLEPELSDLKAFEHGWKDASGSLWRQSQNTSRFCDVYDQHEHERQNDHYNYPDLVQESQQRQVEDRSYEMVKESLSTRRLRKGKFKAVDLPPPSLPPVPITISAVITQSTPLVITNEDAKARDEQDAMDWQVEAKRRKQLWRGLIGKDPGFGRFWEKLSRPHVYSNIGSLPDLPRPPDYNLFRNYQTAIHPFHPDFHCYVSKNPLGRLYWLIPVHGPVIVPSLNDEIIESGTNSKEKDVPIPSSAEYAAQHTQSTSAKIVRPALLKWSPELLDHFVKSFLLPLRQSRLFSLSVAFSGPKPDPFINLPSPGPLTRHLYASKSKSKSKATKQGDQPTPVRPEAGDHMRIYCDAKEALSLRTWLNGVAIDPTIIGQAGQAGGGVESKAWKLFDKVRLCLVGERGEVLMIA